MKYVLLLIALIIGSAQAQTPGNLNFTIRWKPPTERVNGTPVKPEELRGYIVAYRILGTDEFTFDMSIADKNVNELKMSLPRAAYELGVISVDTDDVWSQMSNLITHGVEPNPPTEIKIQAQFIINIEN